MAATMKRRRRGSGACSPYDVYRSNPGAGAGGFTIEQFEQFETSVNSVYPGLLPELWPNAAQKNWIQNMAAQDGARFADKLIP